MKQYFFLLVILFISLTSALDTSQFDFTYSTSTNYSLVNVNDSLYWQGHTGTDGSWLTGIDTSAKNPFDQWLNTTSGVQFRNITETITTNNYGLKINRSFTIAPTDAGVPIVNITNIMPAGSVGLNTFDGLLLETYYSGAVQVGYNNLHSKLNMSSQITGGNNVLGETVLGQGLAGNGIIGLIHADRQTATSSGNTAGIEGINVGNRSTDLYGAYTKAQNLWTGKAFGYYGYGQTNTGNSTGIFGFAQSSTGFATALAGQTFSQNANSFGSNIVGHNHFSGGVTYFYSSQALQQARNTTNFRFNDTGSVWIQRYLEVNNYSWFNDSVSIAKNLNVTGNFTGNQIYGGAWYNNYTATIIDFASDGVYYPLFMTNATNLNGFVTEGIGFGLFSNLTAKVGGVYQINYMATGSGQNNHIYRTSIFVNNVNKPECEHTHKMTAGGDIITQTGICIISLSINDDVSVKIADIGGTGDGNYYSSNLNIVRIGN